VLSIFASMLALPGPARAQERAQENDASPAAPPTRPPATLLTQEQLDSFVELTGDPKPWVWQRLLADPGLVPFAAAAADARMDRRSTGMDCGYYESCEPDKSMLLGGLGLMAVSIGTGLGLGIPGIIRMARQSEAETEAARRYHPPELPQMPPYPGPYPTAKSVRAGGFTLSAPILSFTF
jgi:hypothetical protein